MGPSEVEFEFGKAKVVRADTVFEVREALRSAEKEKRRLVLLTGLQQNDLGHDVVGRLQGTERRRFSPKCPIFQSRRIARFLHKLHTLKLAQLGKVSKRLSY